MKNLILLISCLLLSINMFGESSDFMIENGVLIKYTGEGGDVIIPGEVTSIGDSAFYSCKKLSTITIPTHVSYIGKCAFMYCENLTSVVIPSGVTALNEFVFSYCESLTSVKIPQGVTSIKEDAFSSCYKLASVELPPTLMSIGESAFAYINDLTSVVIPESVQVIEEFAFYESAGLTSVSMGDSIMSIGKKTFAGTSLQNVTIKTTFPPDITGLDVFDEVDLTGAVLTVPAGTSVYYKDAAGWKEFGTIKDVYVYVEEPQPVVPGEQGQLDLILSLPEEGTFEGSFTITLPNGFLLNALLSSLDESLAKTDTFSVSFLDDNQWEIRIMPKTPFFRSSYSYQKVMSLVYDIPKNTNDGIYSAVISDLSFELADGTKITEDVINMNIIITKPSGVKEIDCTYNTYFQDNYLHVLSPVAENVYIYSTSGVLLWRIQKEAGISYFPVNTTEQFIFVCGSSGWVKKLKSEI